jgi:hypothetical protein
MAEPRPVRIPRMSPDTARVVRAPRRAASALPVEPPVAATPPQPNRGGTQRAVRLTGLYLGVLAVLYVVFVLYDRTTPGGTSPGAETGLLEFSVVAILLGVVGGFLSLGSAPRSILWSSTSLIVVTRWGRHTEWTPVSEITIRSVRTHPAGFLSDTPVKAVEVSGPGHRPRSYLIESELLPERRPEAVPR